MANYSDLIAGIRQVIIPNNHANEIDGGDLLNSLLAMISALGVGYQFAGVAVPTTNPGTPDQNVFYIAGRGHYPNFGGMVVREGKIGLFSYNGTWKYEIVTVSSLDSIFEPRQNVVLTPYQTDVLGFYTADGQLITNYPTWKHDIYYVGDIEPTSMKGTTSFISGQDVAVFVFLDSDMNFLGYKELLNGAADYDNFELVNYIPSGTAYIAITKYPQTTVTGLVASGNFIACDAATINQIKADIEALKLKTPDILDSIFTEKNGVELAPYLKDVLGYYTPAGELKTNLPSWKHDLYYVGNLEPTSLLASTSFNDGSGIAVFVFLDKELNFLGYQEVLPSPTTYTNVEIAPSFPEGTAFVSISKYPSSAETRLVASGRFVACDAHTIDVIKADIEALEQRIPNALMSIFKDVANYSLTPYQTNALGFYLPNGQLVTNYSDWKRDIYYIGNINPLSLKGTTKFSTGDGVAVFVFLDADQNFLGYKEMLPGGGAAEYNNFELASSIPVGTQFVSVSKYPQTEQTSMVVTGGIVACDAVTIDQMKEDISELQEKVISADDKPILTAIVKNNMFAVRIPFSDTQDIVVRFSKNQNGFYSPYASYIGLKTDSTDAILASSPFHDTYDTIAPVETSNYWFIGGEHGYLVPVVTSATHDKTSDDLGSWWQDTNGKRFQLIAIDGQTLTFAPRITIGPDGTGTSDYTPNYNVTDLSYVSGATHTSTIVVTSSSSAQLKPCTANIRAEFYNGGELLTEDDFDTEFQCAEFKYVISYDVLNPGTLTHLLPPPMTGQTWFNITQSFLFIGLACSTRQFIKFYDKLPLDYYGATQPLGLTTFGNYHSFLFIPKVKPMTSGGVTTDWKVPQDVTTPGQTWGGAAVHLSDVIDQNNLPERVVEYYQNPNTQEKTIGFASGFSLLGSGAVSSKRLANVGTDIFLSIANDGRNKLYFRVISGQGAVGQVLPKDFTIGYNYYHCYFNPKENDALVYWYKDGESYVIYVHAFATMASCKVNLPDFLDGKNLAVVEKTDDAELLTETVIDKAFFVKFASASPNYIVLKTL